MPEKEKPGTRRSFLTGFLDNVNSNDSLENESNHERVHSYQSSLEREQSHFEVYSKDAMACKFELMFNMHQFPNAASAALSAFQLIDDYEEQMTVYRDSSEISYINATAAQQDVEVEPSLFRLLQAAMKISKETKGAYDITSWPLSDLWGFTRRQGKVPDESSIAEALDQVSYELCELKNGHLRFLNPNLKINLGGIGKGYALDHATQQILDVGISDFIFHGGQSSVVARGDNSTHQSDQGWVVGLSHPVIPGKRIAEIRLNNLALGTSGTGRQGFFHQGKRYGHIIDPRTGFPTDHFYSTTVVCPNAAEADALATAFFVMNLNEVQSYCDKHQSISAVIVNKTGDATEFNIETFNMTSDLLKIL